MTLILPYNELHSNLTDEQNKAVLEKVAEIIKINQLRSIGMTDQERITELEKEVQKLKIALLDLAYKVGRDIGKTTVVVGTEWETLKREAKTNNPYYLKNDIP